MNNIEILEEFIDKVDIYFNDDIGDCAITSKIAGIIKNLIQENKKLKKQMGKDLEVVYIKGVYDERDKWKNKVKEKIKELDKKMAEDEVDEFGIHSQGWAALDWTRDFLLELLGGE